MLFKLVLIGQVTTSTNFLWGKKIKNKKEAKKKINYFQMFSLCNVSNGFIRMKVSTLKFAKHGKDI